MILDKSEKLKVYIDEYEFCSKKASDMESNIWKTAIIYGIGTAFSLFKFFGIENIFYIYIASILAWSFCLLWWRLVKRWRTIQNIMFNRMSEIEKELNMKLNIKIKNEDNDKKKYWKRKDLWSHKIPKYKKEIIKDDDYNKIEKDESKKSEYMHYECRGYLPMIEFTIIIICICWLLLIIYSFFKNEINCVLLNLCDLQIVICKFALFLIPIISYMIVLKKFWSKS